jgi:hypothetical protein
MTLKILLAGAALAVGLAGFTAANAGSTIIGKEDNATGFNGGLFGPGSPYMVASDGESPFDPYGFGHDTSDGLNFANVGHVWTQAADSTWVSLGNQTWVLPASTPCGNENEPVCEPVGHFISPDAWSPGAIGTWRILEADGSISDKIVTFNTANGAELLFYSDPGVPEPSVWFMMLIGVAGIGYALRKQRVAAAASLPA